LLKLEARHHGVQHAVLEEKFASLEAFGQFLPDGLFDHARAREADQRARFGNIEIAQHGVACGDAARGRVGQDADEGEARFVEAKSFSANHVKVVTEQNVVYLMGIVRPVEGDEAVHIARTTSGVERVVKLFEYFQG